MTTSNIPLSSLGNGKPSSNGHGNGVPDKFFSGSMRLELDQPAEISAGGMSNRTPAQMRSGPAAIPLIDVSPLDQSEVTLTKTESCLENMYHQDPDNVALHRHHLAVHHGDPAHQHHHQHGHDKGDGHKPTTKFHTFVNLIKGNIGTGILTLPYAMTKAGLLLGTIGLLVVGFLCTFCMHQLLDVYRKVLRRRPGREMDYADVVEACFQDSASPLFRSMSRFAKHAINGFLVFTQFGVCCVYLNFSSSMIHFVVETYTDIRIPYQLYQAAVALLLIPTCFVRTLHILAIFSTVANFLTIGALCFIMQYVFRNLKDYSTVPMVISGPSIFQWFGSVIFAYESITFVLPFEMKMKDRVSFHYWDGLMTLSMVVVIVIYTTVAFYGYLAFGQDAVVILKNLPSTWMYHSIRLIYAVCIFLSYSLQLFIPVQICWPPLRHKLRNSPFLRRYGEYIFRTCWLIITFLLAATIPCLEQMISLVGSLAISSLALFFPAILEIVVNVPANPADEETPEKRFPPEIPATPVSTVSQSPRYKVVRFPDEDAPSVGWGGFIWICIRCGGIIMISIAAFFVGSYIVILDIIDALYAGTCY